MCWSPATKWNSAQSDTLNPPVNDTLVQLAEANFFSNADTNSGL